MNDNYLNSKELKNLNFKFLGKNVKISSNVTIIGAEKIKIGDNVRIDDYTQFQFMMVFWKLDLMFILVVKVI